MELEKDVVIVGAGIAGVATAVALKRVGVQALVLERSDCLRTTGSALSLTPNAWLALEALGVSHKLTAIYSPLAKMVVTNVATGAVQVAPFPGANGGDEGRKVRTIHRKVLLETLAQELPNDSIRFSSKLVAIKNQQEGSGAPMAIVHLEDGTVIKSKALIGCDGLHSMVGRLLGLAAPAHSGRSAARGLTIFPEGHGIRQEVHQFVDVGRRAGFSPLNDKELYWFLVCESPPNEKEFMAKPELIQKELLEHLARDFPSNYLDVVRRADLSTLTWAPLMLRYPWHILLGNISQGNMTIAGDAMHPMTPDLAQGGCCALEDAVVLGRHIGNSVLENGGVLVPQEMPRALDGYVKERRWRAMLVVTTAYLSGWSQQGGTNWWMKFLRDSLFYKYIFGTLAKLTTNYQCGKLPTAVSPPTKED